jgi:hypothetical protein
MCGGFAWAGCQREISMTSDRTDETRRTVLKTAGAGLAACVTGLGSAITAPGAEKPYGKPGDFDFLAGEWKIKHRQRKTAGGNDWDDFEGEATVHPILAGVGSIEELRIPARGFSGAGIRLLDVEKRVWNDFWVNAKSGVLTTPGLSGVFVDGVGTFEAEDVDDGKPFKVRGVWDRITPTSCRWRQGLSKDGGKTWDEGWFMDWTRVPGASRG